VNYISNCLVYLHSRLIGARSCLRREEGQGLVEYGLIITFVAIVAIAGLTVLGNDIKEFLKKVGEEL
jgi:pilus assembly protein Flp/PilA